MVKPRVVSRSGSDEFEGEAWNAMINICVMENASDMTFEQAVAHRVFWYMSEVTEGGHVQYFLNRIEDNLDDVINSLKYVGAEKCAAILHNAVLLFAPQPEQLPVTDIAGGLNQTETQLKALNGEFIADGATEIMRCLKRYATEHEAAFVTWTN